MGRIFKTSYYDGGNVGWGNLVEEYECYNDDEEWLEVDTTSCDDLGRPDRSRTVTEVFALCD